MHQITTQQSQNKTIQTVHINCPPVSILSLSFFYSSVKPLRYRHINGPGRPADGEDFLAQKFQGFDFQSVKQSFMRQDLLEQERKRAASDDDSDDNSCSDECIKTEPNGNTHKTMGNINIYIHTVQYIVSLDARLATI